MSVVGPGGMGYVPLTGSVAGTAGQRKVAETNQQQAQGADRQAAADRQAQFEQSVRDVDASGETGDRDADGRQPWVITRRRATSEGPGDSPARGEDADGERGGQLDLEA